MAVRSATIPGIEVMMPGMPPPWPKRPKIRKRPKRPRPRRLEKAREDGQVARSRELTTVMLLFGGVGGLWSMGPTLFDQVGMVMEQSFLFDRRQGFDSTVMLTHAVGPGRAHPVRTDSAVPDAGRDRADIAQPAGRLPDFRQVPQAPALQNSTPSRVSSGSFPPQALAELGHKAIAKSILVGSVAVAFLSAKRGEFMALMDQPHPAGAGQCLCASPPWPAG